MGGASCPIGASTALDADAFVGTARATARGPVLCRPDQFEQIGLIPLGYNRAIPLMAQAFLGIGETFGDSPETGRLTPQFDFYAA
jgi:hypothetical protein